MTTAFKVNEFETEKEKHLSENFVQRFLINKFLRGLDKILKSLLSTNSEVLDAGCGIGITIRYLREHNRDLKIIGFDILSDSISYAQKLNPDAKLFNADLYNIPFKDNSFDIVLNTETLEHLRNPLKALNELKRITSRYCIICVPYEPFFSIANLLRLKYIKTLGNYPGHIHQWNIKKFRKLLSPYFKKISIKTSTLWIIALCEK